uniref:Uncharacterized protein n=1 Tax=Drosophila melanogaster TaxID=7227 RepID=A0A0B4JD70_DROME|nr:uncharacterized protein Dmel_CG42649 [Drosophila melanogaster]ADV37210.1 uncharacterized protein Dmel_CG42649 [Drosophila melanogaster]|eukprot:NP_001188964.1 uncharacterized protein Dmel_CG42649 [Drosophila melanogaster]
MKCLNFIVLSLLLILPQFYSHRHPGFAQRLQIKPGCLQVPQIYTEAPTPTPTIIFSSLEEVGIEDIRRVEAD